MSTVRIPVFESSPARRRRVDNIIANNTNSETVQNEAIDIEYFAVLQKKKDAARVARQEETLEQRQMRLEKQRSRSRSRVANETEEQRLARLQRQRERSRS